MSLEGGAAHVGKEREDKVGTYREGVEKGEDEEPRDEPLGRDFCRVPSSQEEGPWESRPTGDKSARVGDEDGGGMGEADVWGGRGKGNRGDPGGRWRGWEGSSFAGIGSSGDRWPGGGGTGATWIREGSSSTMLQGEEDEVGGRTTAGCGTYVRTITGGEEVVGDGGSPAGGHNGGPDKVGGRGVGEDRGEGHVVRGRGSRIKGQQREWRVCGREGIVEEGDLEVSPWLEERGGGQKGPLGSPS
ncbi:hypothetical protein AMTRI_Chr03g47040 [Amborella trichopoda]